MGDGKDAGCEQLGKSVSAAFAVVGEAGCERPFGHEIAIMLLDVSGSTSLIGTLFGADR